MRGGERGGRTGLPGDELALQSDSDYRDTWGGG